MIGRPKGAISREREVTCEICSTRFLTRHSQGKYCADACKRKGMVKSWTRYRNKREITEDKRLAYNAVNLAVKQGRLIPQPCEQCGEPGEAHHPDYSKPLDVIWLCRVHHREAHGRNKK